MFVNSTVGPLKLTFDQYLKRGFYKLKDREDSLAKGCPYHLGRMVVTLDKYEKSYADISNRQLWHQASLLKLRENVSFKYFPIMVEMAKAFYSMNTDAGREHISGLEFMFNAAFTALIRKDRNNLSLVQEFLEESLLNEHPLKVFGGLRRFYEDAGLNDLNSGYLTPIIRKYEENVHEAVLTVLGTIVCEHIIAGKLSEVGLIDLLILIRQHFASLLHSFDENDGYMQRIIWMSIKFPDEALKAFSRFIQENNNWKSTEALYWILYDNVCLVDPYKFASAKHDFDQFPILDNPFYLPYYGHGVILSYKALAKIFKRSETLNEFRLKMIAISMVSYLPPLDRFSVSCIILSDAQVFHVLFLYEILKKTSRLLPGLVSEMFGRSANDLLQEVETIMKTSLISSFDRKELYLYSLGYGMFESVKWFWAKNLELKHSHYFDLLDMVVLDQTVVVDLLMQNVFLLEPFATGEINALLHFAAKRSSLEVFQAVLRHVPVDYTVPFSDLLDWAISARNFVNFDFLCEEYIGTSLELMKQLKRSRRLNLIIFAIDSRLPEAKIREYIDKFGADVVMSTSAEIVPDSRLLEAAAANGFFDIIKEYGLSGIKTSDKAVAIKNAAKFKQPAILKYIIDSIENEIQFADLFRLLVPLVKFQDGHHLLYLMSKRFDAAEITAEMKAQIIFGIIIYLDPSAYSNDKRAETVEVVLNFCRMMSWSRLQIGNADASNPLIPFGLREPELFEEINQECLNSLPDV